MKYLDSLLVPFVVLFAMTCPWPFGGSALAQGPAVVMPMSKAVTDPGEAISFYIHNQMDESLSLKYEPKCDLAGREETGSPCLEAFDLSFDSSINDAVMTIPKGGKVGCLLKLKRKDLTFAIFKPLFSPILAGSQTSNKVTFEMKYQPGYLFLISPLKEQISEMTYQVLTIEGTRRMRFQLDIGQLSAPQVIGVTVKVLELKTKKLIRLLRLASEKIADPKRKILDLEGEFAEKLDSREVCYEMFISNLTAKDIYKKSNCP